MRVLILSDTGKYAINLAREVARLLNCRTFLSTEEQVAISYGSDRDFAKNSDSRSLRKIYSLETRFLKNVVIANGVLQYFILKLYYWDKKLTRPEYRLLKEIYSTYDHVVCIIPKTTLSCDSELFCGFKEGFAGICQVVLGNLGFDKLIMDYNIAKDLKKRAKKIAVEIAKRERG